MRTHRPLAATLLIALLGTVSCSAESQFELPERTPAVRAEEVRLGALIERAARFGQTEGSCEVRLLGSADATAYVWAKCEFPNDGPDAPIGWSSAPFRVDGEKVRHVRDGALYAQDVRALFPEPIADAILKHEDFFSDDSSR